jgi:hypothetical protein
VILSITQKKEGSKKRKTNVASEVDVSLQVWTTKEDAKKELAKDSSTSTLTKKESLQVQPSVENPLLSMQDTLNSPNTGIFHLLDITGMHYRHKQVLHTHSHLIIISVFYVSS